MLKTISLFVMAAFYVYAGVNHFRHPRFYYRLIPPFLKRWEQPINVISGAAEIILGILLLIPATTQGAAWGVIALLIAVYPANIYHFTSKGAGMKISQQMLGIRLVLQFALIAWAYWHTIV